MVLLRPDSGWDPDLYNLKQVSNLFFFPSFGRVEHCPSRFFQLQRWLQWAVCSLIRNPLEASTLAGRPGNVGLRPFSIDGAGRASDQLLYAAAAFDAELCIVLVGHDSCSGYFTNFSYCFEFLPGRKLEAVGT